MRFVVAIAQKILSYHAGRKKRNVISWGERNLKDVLIKLLELTFIQLKVQWKCIKLGLLGWRSLSLILKNIFVLNSFQERFLTIRFLQIFADSTEFI